MVRVINGFPINRADRMNTKHTDSETSSANRERYRGENRVHPVTYRSPEKPCNKLKEGAVKVAAGGFIRNQDHPEDHPDADNENKFSFHVSVSFCG